MFSMKFFVLEKEMDDSVYRFQLGDLSCSLVNDGVFTYANPDQILFVNAPRKQLAAELHSFDIELAKWKSWASSYPCLLIENSNQKLLVDTGAGSLSPSTGKLHANLQNMGVQLHEIDFVLLTHAHPDHIGGVLNDQGQPAFPNACYLISPVELEFWMDPPELCCANEQLTTLILDCVKANLPPLSRQIQEIEPNTEIMPGIMTIDAAGHTPGQLGLQITSQSGLLLALADTIVHPLQIKNPDWISATDVDYLATVETRRRIIERTAAQNALVFGFHFPSPGLGHIIGDKTLWKWVPLPIDQSSADARFENANTKSMRQ